MANEKRLIDANAIYDAVERRYQMSSGIEHRCERDLLDLICSADTVDAVEVVHGRWVLGNANHREYMKCSMCLKSQTPTGVFTYCPNCGAKMDGGINNE